MRNRKMDGSPPDNARSELLCSRCRSNTIDMANLENDSRLILDGGDLKPEIFPLRHGFPPQDHGHNYDHYHYHDHDHDHDHDQAHDSGPKEFDVEDNPRGPNGPRFRRIVWDWSGMQYHDPTIDPLAARLLEMIRPSRRPNYFEQRADGHQYGGQHICRAIFMSGSDSASVTIFPGSVPELFEPELFWAVTLWLGALWLGALRVGILCVGTLLGQDSFGPELFWAGVLWAGTFCVGTFWFGTLCAEISWPGVPLRPVSRVIWPTCSQEVRIRIITHLMEAHLQSSSAPPASIEALDNLDRRSIDAIMLKSGSDVCTICIDSMKVGDMAIFLPCKHNFHDDCVTSWLNQHNTCPLCRASIEKPEESNPSRHTSPIPDSHPGL
ncbi:hypothetical protein GGI35DRAFT_202442 [Trichoderma velutinum]